MSLPKSARIVEVGPRDGLQNESANLPPALRSELIRKLADCGHTHIEAGSFVNPKWVPQIASPSLSMNCLSRQPVRSCQSL